MAVTAIQIAVGDNVATLVAELGAAGQVTIVGHGGGAAVPVPGPVPRGHKIALRAIAPGEAVVKFGAPIGRALRPIARGEWVHLHNLASARDARSGTLDLRSGAPTDNNRAYE